MLGQQHHPETDGKSIPEINFGPLSRIRKTKAPLSELSIREEILEPHKRRCGMILPITRSQLVLHQRFSLSMIVCMCKYLHALAPLGDPCVWTLALVSVPCPRRSGFNHGGYARA
jgi:hypothetical protein